MAVCPYSCRRCAKLSRSFCIRDLPNFIQLINSELWNHVSFVPGMGFKTLWVLGKQHPSSAWLQQQNHKWHAPKNTDVFRNSAMLSCAQDWTQMGRWPLNKQWAAAVTGPLLREVCPWVALKVSLRLCGYRGSAEEDWVTDDSAHCVWTSHGDSCLGTSQCFLYPALFEGWLPPLLGCLFERSYPNPIKINVFIESWWPLKNDNWDFLGLCIIWATVFNVQKIDGKLWLGHSATQT